MFVVRRGRSELTTTILSEGQVRDLVEEMLKSTGRRVDLSTPFVVPTVASSVDIVVHTAKDGSGHRRTREIVAVPGRVEGDVVEVADLFVSSGQKLVRAQEFPPHQERFERAGLVRGLTVISMTTPADTYYYQHDGQGSITSITDSTGALQTTYAYEPYGDLRTNQNATSNAPDNNLRYTGEYHDSYTDTYDLRARQYDPSTGPFTQTDPQAPNQRDPYVSSYAYTQNRPTSRTDPSGRTSSECGIITCTIISHSESTAEIGEAFAAGFAGVIADLVPIAEAGAAFPPLEAAIPALLMLSAAISAVSATAFVSGDCVAFKYGACVDIYSSSCPE